MPLQHQELRCLACLLAVLTRPAGGELDALSRGHHQRLVCIKGISVSCQVGLMLTACQWLQVLKGLIRELSLPLEVRSMPRYYAITFTPDAIAQYICMGEWELHRLPAAQGQRQARNHTAPLTLSPPPQAPPNHPQQVPQQAHEPQPGRIGDLVDDSPARPAHGVVDVLQRVLQCVATVLVPRLLPAARQSAVERSLQVMGTTGLHTA